MCIATKCLTTFPFHLVSCFENNRPSSKRNSYVNNNRPNVNSRKPCCANKKLFDNSNRPNKKLSSGNNKKRFVNSRLSRKPPSSNSKRRNFKLSNWQSKRRNRTSRCSLALARTTLSTFSRRVSAVLVSEAILGTTLRLDLWVHLPRPTRQATLDLRT